MDNEYKEAIKLIKDNNLKIIKRVCYDPQSDWNGTNYIVVDGKKEITDFSINGFCFEERNFNKCIKEIKDYLKYKNMETFEDFKMWVEANAQIEEELQENKEK